MNGHEMRPHLAYTGEDLTAFECAIRDLKGSYVRLEGFQVSLSILSFLVKKSETGEEFRLECLEVQTLKLPVKWEDCCLEILDESSNILLEHYRLVDERAGVEISCGGIVLRSLDC